MKAPNAYGRPQDLTQDSNAYELWLGIPPAEQPPNFYRFLDLPLFESEPARIAQALKNRESQIEIHTGGPHDRAAKKLLKQVSHVRTTFACENRKATYDKKLRAKLSERSDDAPVAPIERLILCNASDNFKKTRWLPEQVLALVSVMALGVLAISVAAIVWQPAREDQTVVQNQAITTRSPQKSPGTAGDTQGNVKKTTHDSNEAPPEAPRGPSESLPGPPNTEAEHPPPIAVDQTPAVENEDPSGTAASAVVKSILKPEPGSPPTQPPADNDTPIARLDPQQFLAERGVRIVENRLVLQGEVDLKSRLETVADLLGELNGAHKAQLSLQGRIGGVEKRIKRLTGQMMKMNARMRRLKPGNVLGNNQIVAELNILHGKREVLVKDKQEIAADLDRARAREFTARETYIGDILEMQRLADQIDQKYRRLIRDPDVVKSIDALNAHLAKQQKFVLQRSGDLEQYLGQLKELAKAVLSEVIPIRRTPSDSLYVAATLNEDKTIEMVLDSGATLVCLSQKVAAHVGVKTSAADAKLVLQLADGRTVSGTAVTIPTMRIGQFTVKNVEAVVLGPDAPFAESLLGMSFLRHFQFKIDPAANELKLIGIGSETHIPKKRR